VDRSGLEADKPDRIGCRNRLPWLRAPGGKIHAKELDRTVIRPPQKKEAAVGAPLDPSGETKADCTASSLIAWAAIDILNVAAWLQIGTRRDKEDSSPIREPRRRVVFYEAR